MNDKLETKNIVDMSGLSPLQKGILFHYLENQNSDAYVEKVCVELKGVIQDKCFYNAWQAVVNAHEMLRAVFRWEKIQNPVQIILKEKRLNLEIYSLMDQEGDAIIESKKVDLQHHPFSLVLLKGEFHHQLWLIYSHILLDGWSVSLLMKDFLDCYHAFIEGHPLPNDEKPKFKSYLKYLQTSPTENSKQYWKELLYEAPIQSHILPDHIYHTNHIQYDWICKEVDPRLFQAMAEYAKAHYLPTSILIYLAWLILLHKYSRSQDVLFGISMSLRQLPIANIDKTVGLLINTIPMRLSIHPDSKVSDLLQLLHQQFIESQNHASLPLTEIKKIGGGRSREELFDSLMVIENYPLYDSAIESHKSLIVSGFSNKEFTHYPLTIIVDLLKQANVKLSYDACKYSENYISQILDHFFVILSEIVKEDSREIKDIQLLSASEAKDLITRLNQTEVDYPRESTIIDLFREQARQHVRKKAIIAKEGSLTYEELDHLSDQLAHEMKERGVCLGEKIGVMLPKGNLMIIALLAILKANAVYVSMNPKLPSTRKEYIIQDCGIRCLVTHEETDINQPKMIFFERNVCCEKKQEVADSSLVYVLYSSGSTGKPKGIMIPQKGIIRLVKNANFISFCSQDRCLSTCPLDFDVSALEIWGCLLNGATLVLLDELTLLMPDQVKTTLVKHKINKLWLSTPLFNAWVNADLSLFQDLEALIVGGDILSPSHIARVKKAFPDLKLINGYGPTENSVLSTYFEILDLPYMRIPIGKPISNSTAYIVDFFGNIQPVGALGEVWLGGDGVARGYQNKPELNREKFIKNPFGEGWLYKSGDVGRWLPDGSIDFFGREDFQVKIRGYRIELFEIELAIKSYPLILEAVVVAEKNDVQDKELVAYIQKKNDFPLTDLKQFLDNRIPQYCIPTIFVPLISFPYTTTGKIDRQGLNKYRKTVLEDKDHALPISHTELEKILVGIYEKVLQKSSISIFDHFFDIGGNSLHTIQIRSLIQKELQIDIAITDIFQFPTISALAKHLEKPTIKHKQEINQSIAINSALKEEIAIIGLSGRFPEAESILKFWKNLCEGHHSIQRFNIDELLREGLPQELVQKANYIPCKGFLKDIEFFDHHFFGYTEREAEMMDPQMRLLHECCWEVLEDAGYVPESYQGRIGVFIGSEINVQWINALLKQLKDPTELWQAAHYNIHSMSAAISYKLKLTGPSLTLDTACSSSLVAIHQAKQSILAGECEMAIAGGVSLELPRKAGYIYEEGMIRSRTGECRAFDASATGTVSGDGIGLVLLKPLSQALRDRDHIYAILKGSAINNDGDRKVGYTAPSIVGQREVIKMALKDAHVSAEAVSYIEAHGTGTKLGDPIEIKALSEVYVSNQNLIKIGSVKTNVGHLNTAAGVAGFIKTTLALYHQYLPPSLHFERENPDCHFENTCMRVIAKGENWQALHRLAAVSSFGIGGTNAHVILGEFVSQEEILPSKENAHLLLFSARSQTALNRRIQSLKELLDHAKCSLEDLSYNLQVGRKHFEYRSAFICRDKEEAQKIVSGSHFDFSLISQDTPPLMTFVFSGQGGSHIQISKFLYDQYPTIKKHMDMGLSILKSEWGVDLFPLLFSDNAQDLNDLLKQTHYLQVITFVYSYSISLLLRECGIIPKAMIGHSVGEYVAACLAGIFTFEEGINILIRRGKLMSELVEGRMLALRTTQAIIADLLAKFPRLSLAAINSPEDFVVSGDPHLIEKANRLAKEQNIPAFPLATSRAFHSKDILSIREELLDLFSKIRFQKPNCTYVSSLTGNWIQPEEVIKPEYWVEHACQTVQFSKGIQTLLKQGLQIFLEIGPTRTLSSLINRHLDAKQKDKVLSFVVPASDASEQEVFLNLLRQLWLNGIEINWSKLYPVLRQRISLPPYPFDHYYFWKFGNISFSQQESVEVLSSPDSHAVNHFKSVWQPISLSPSKDQPRVIWIIHRGSELDRRLLNHFQNKAKIFEFDFSKKKNNSSFLHWCMANMASLQEDSQVLYTLCFEEEVIKGEINEEILRQKMDLYFDPLLQLIQALGQETSLKTIDLRLIANQAISISELEPMDAIKSMLVAFLRSVQNEYHHFRTQFIEIESQDNWNDHFISILESEIHPKMAEVVLRKEKGILGLSYQKIQKDEKQESIAFKRHGVYFIIGGLGGIGLVIAKFLAEKYAAQLILTGRSIQLDSEKMNWIEQIKMHAKSLEMIQLDVGHEENVQEVVAKIYQKYEKLHGIIHLAGVQDEGLIQTKTKADFQLVFYPKVLGSAYLVKALKNHSVPDFILLGSSIATANGDYGQSAYVMANYFLNSFAKDCYVNKQFPIVSLNWDTWREVGMAKRYQQKITTKPYHHHVWTLSREQDWILNEHLIQGDPILPGTGFVSLLLQQINKLGFSFPILISSIQFIEPLILKNSQSVKIKVTFFQFTENEFQFLFHHILPENREILLCEGKFCIRDSSSSASTLTKKGIFFDNSVIFPIDKCIKANNQNMQFGPRWNNIRKVEYSKTSGIATLHLPEKYLKDLEHNLVHPALLDTASSFLIDIFYPTSHLLPIAYQDIKIYSPFSSRMYSYATLLKEATSSKENQTLSLHLQLFNENHICCLEGEIIFKEMDRRVASDSHDILELQKIGDLTSFHYTPSSSRVLEEDEVEFETIATGVNFKEVLYALGLIPNLSQDHIFQFGLEASGIVTQIGKCVTRFKPGDAVMGLVSGGFNKFVQANENYLILKPDSFTFEEAASLIISFITAYDALVRKANLKPQEKVFIHSAAGGVGLAAIEIAKAIGAEVYASAGTTEKQAHLKQMGVKEVFHSRDVDFVHQVLSHTHGVGVDVVLNSSTGEILKGVLEIIAPYGRFIEMGVKEILESGVLGKSIFKKSISLIPISISPAMPHYLESLQEVMRNLENRVWNPIPMKIYDRTHIHSAFEWLASGKNIGKVVVVHKPMHQLSILNAQYSKRDKIQYALLNQEAIESFRCVVEQTYAKHSFLTEVYVTKRNQVKRVELRIQEPLASRQTNKRKRPALSTSYAPASNGIEDGIIHLMEDFLGIEEIGVNDNFFDLGMTSLDIIQIKSMISHKFSLDIPVVQFYSSSTVVKLAHWIQIQDEAKSSFSKVKHQKKSSKKVRKTYEH